MALIGCGWWGRDPFFWIAKNDGVISWHLVLHNDPRGVHFHSGDGVKWELQQKLDAKGNPQPPHFFDEHIHQTDGTVATCAPRPCALLGMSHCHVSVAERRRVAVQRPASGAAVDAVPR